MNIFYFAVLSDFLKYRNVFFCNILFKVMISISVCIKMNIRQASMFYNFRVFLYYQKTRIIFLYKSIRISICLFVLKISLTAEPIWWLLIYPRKVFNYFEGGYHHPPKRNCLQKKCSPPPLFFFILKQNFKKGGIHFPKSAPRGLQGRSLINLYKKV